MVSFTCNGGELIRSDRRLAFADGDVMAPDETGGPELKSPKSPEGLKREDQFTF